MTQCASLNRAHVYSELWRVVRDEAVLFSPTPQTCLRVVEKTGGNLVPWPPARKTARQSALEANLPSRSSIISMCRVRFRVSGAILRRNVQSAVAAGACCGVIGPWIAGLGDARCDW